MCHKKDSKSRLLISLPIKYNKITIIDMLNHEIGTHFVRKYNNRFQIWHKNKIYKRINLKYKYI